ncbi:protein ILITYHIA [Corchorus olitorius]|uniref:Protein ILITYHIA n=1 Tax=Corchorus olitorius TaxID=93759 RepID=A0A1R3HYL2_9ROSI|nr:protein ILITYHIA [Corchorus olitorius]
MWNAHASMWMRDMIGRLIFDAEIGGTRIMTFKDLNEEDLRPSKAKALCSMALELKLAAFLAYPTLK